MPNAPKRTFASERFIARAISVVSSVPEAPTSIPLTIRTFECSTNPVAAAARPVKAFSSEITTGMSAPPIGSTKTIPNSAATPIAAASSQNSTETIATAASAIAPTNRSALPTCWAGYVIGRPLISSWSFPKATSEPENEIEPTSAEMTVATPRSTPTSPACAQTLWNSTSETRAAAPPPTPLNSATICGIAVIFTFFAPTTPITEPISIPAAIHHQPVDDLVQPERDENRPDHPGGADLDAEARVTRRREEAQREDERHDRDQVQQIRGGLTHGALSRALRAS